MNVPTADLEALMSAYSERIRGGNSAGIDDIVPEIACNWVKNKLKVNTASGGFTGANTAKWVKWIPRTCEPGSEYDKAVGACRECKLGEYSVGGRRCIPCSPGFFTDQKGSVGCQLCDQGKWQSELGGTNCTDCPAGSQRSSSDQQGCRQCSPGYFAGVPGQAECTRCAVGFWTAESGSSACNQCSSNLVTFNQGSDKVDDCVCLNGTYWPCRQGADVENISWKELCSLGRSALVGFACTDCPAGMVCVGGVESEGGEVWHAQPMVKPRHYASLDSPYQAFECISAGLQCPGGNPSQCVGGRHGLQCHSCAMGWRATTGRECFDCRTTGEYALMPCWILLAACGLGAIYKFSSGKKNKSPSKTAMVGTFSIIAVNTLHAEISSQGRA